MSSFSVGDLVTPVNQSEDANPPVFKVTTIYDIPDVRTGRPYMQIEDMAGNWCRPFQSTFKVFEKRGMLNKDAFEVITLEDGEKE